MGRRSMSTNLGFYVPDDFAQNFRDRARDDGCNPSHRLQGLERVLDRYDLDAEVRAESIVIRDEGILRQQLGQVAGGRAGKGRPKSRPKKL